MNIVQPSVKLLGKVDPEDFLAVIAYAGHVCYQSEGKTSDEEFIRKCISRGHESLIEHRVLTFSMVCDRGVSHELVRHRIASYSQESTRYVNYKLGLTVIDLATGFHYDMSNPKHVKRYEIWQRAARQSEENYREMLEYDAPPEEARSVLINSTKTEVVFTMNPRELRHFFKLRLSKRAHPQMRQAAYLVYDECMRLVPVFFENLEVATQ